MRVELDISMAGGDGEDPTAALNSIRRLIDDSSHALGSHNQCGECNWYALMALVRRCHEQARELSTHVMTTVHIEDEEDEGKEKAAGSGSALAENSRMRACG
jgi:hypothetical protein